MGSRVILSDLDNILRDADAALERLGAVRPPSVVAERSYSSIQTDSDSPPTAPVKVKPDSFPAITRSDTCIPIGTKAVGAISSLPQGAVSRSRSTKNKQQTVDSKSCEISQGGISIGKQDTVDVPIVPRQQGLRLSRGVQAVATVTEVETQCEGVVRIPQLVQTDPLPCTSQLLQQHNECCNAGSVVTTSTQTDISSLARPNNKSPASATPSPIPHGTHMETTSYQSQDMSLLSHAQELEAENEGLRLQVDQMRTRVAACIAKAEELVPEVVTLRQQREEAQAKAQRVTEVAASLKVENKRLATERDNVLRNARRRVDTYKQDIEDLTAMLREGVRREEALKLQVEEMGKEIEEARSRHKDMIETKTTVGVGVVEEYDVSKCGSGQEESPVGRNGTAEHVTICVPRPFTKSRSMSVQRASTPNTPNEEHITQDKAVQTHEEVTKREIQTQTRNKSSVASTATDPWAIAESVEVQTTVTTLGPNGAQGDKGVDTTDLILKCDKEVAVNAFSRPPRLLLHGDGMGGSFGIGLGAGPVAVELDLSVESNPELFEDVPPQIIRKLQQLEASLAIARKEASRAMEQLGEAQQAAVSSRKEMVDVKRQCASDLEGATTTILTLKKKVEHKNTKLSEAQQARAVLTSERDMLSDRIDKLIDLQRETAEKLDVAQRCLVEAEMKAQRQEEEVVRLNGALEQAKRSAEMKLGRIMAALSGSVGVGGEGDV